MLDRFPLPPPPAAVAATLLRPLIRLTPAPLERAGIELTLNRFFARPIEEQRLDFLEHRTVLIRISDLDLSWPISLRDGRLVLLERTSPADVVISGESPYFVALGLRHEDPDTFFFRRELTVCGDTELGLAVKNFLDGIDPDDMPALLREMPAGLRERLTRLAAWLAGLGPTSTPSPRERTTSPAVH
ncbi:MAG: SCP2 domain-containing protein [Kiloniellaceae bacterium]